MESVLKLIGRVEHTAVRPKAENRQLVEELQEVKRLMSCNNQWFQIECQENLI